MQVSSKPERTLTQLDQVRLQKLIDHLAPLAGRQDATSEEMEELLSQSDVLPSREVPPDLVTMYSKILLADEASGERQEFTLCYPQDADPAAGRVSVLSPAGRALLGMRCGARVQWRAPGGEAISVRVLEVLFQPEASGDYLR